MKSVTIATVAIATAAQSGLVVGYVTLNEKFILDMIRVNFVLSTRLNRERVTVTY